MHPDPLPSPDLITGLVAGLLAVPVEEMRSSARRSEAVSSARAIAIYLAVVECGMTRTAAGLAFGRDRTTVSHAIEWVERLRDDDPCMSLRIETAAGLMRHRRT